MYCCCCSKACKALCGVCRVLSRWLKALPRTEAMDDVESSEEWMGAMEVSTTVNDTSQVHVEMVKEDTTHLDTPRSVKSPTPPHTEAPPLYSHSSTGKYGGRTARMSACASSKAAVREEEGRRDGSQLKSKTASRDLARGEGRTGEPSMSVCVCV